jgi:archaeosine-15-forming tRNA-guanine transglycosylase
MAGTGKGIDLNLNGATKVGANQAYPRETRVIMNEDSRDFGYRGR